MAKRVLIVDDSVSIRSLENMVLKHAGYEVVEACDGEEALRKLETTPVSLILTDLNMPKLDGVALIRSVRSSANHRRTPIIMITTESSDSRKQEGRAAGATAWLVKPFQPDQLLGIVKKVLG